MQAVRGWPRIGPGWSGWCVLRKIIPPLPVGLLRFQDLACCLLT